MSELALKLIAQAKQTRATRLDLGNCGLTELPDELFELTWLEELNLSDEWQESDFHEKEYIWTPTQNAGNSNQIKLLPTQIKNLISLKKLSISVHESTERGELNDITPLKELKTLEYLNISNTEVEDINVLKSLNNLKFLNISSTKVKGLEALKKLKKLKFLYVDYNEVKDLNPLKNLENLKVLELRGNKLIDLEPLKYLINLEYLNLFNTSFNNLEPIQNLQNLRTLWLNQSQVSDIHILKNLMNLQTLAIGGTEVTDLSSLKYLINLKELSLYSLNIDDFSPIGHLTNLEEINLSNNQFQDLNFLNSLSNLKSLNVSKTNIVDLKPLEQLLNLLHLDISETDVNDLSPIENLSNLNRINISKSKVRDLSPLKAKIDLGIKIKLENKAWEEHTIAVKDCPLDKSLIAAIKKGNKAVLNYFNKPKQRLFEVRVLILGEPRAGKTTLRRKLKSVSAPMPTNAESTKAFEIEIEPYTCVHEKDGERNKLTYHLWDFGGQDYYRLLHQLFVAEQSVYIIVTDTDRNKNEEEIDFWLETIQRLGKDKNGNYGPVILFQNPKTQREGSDFVDLKKRYPFWKQGEQFVINLNALDEKNIANPDSFGTGGAFDKKQLDKFKRFKTYLEESFCQLDHIGKEMPTQWINVRKGLAKYEKDNWISVEAFNKVCAAKGITEVSEQDDLLGIFHTLGYVLHYKDSALRGMVILNREWVTDALYRVLDDETVKTNRGWFRKEDAEKIWHEARYKNRTPELLALMEEFKLSYYNPVSQKHIVPAKLPEDTEGLPTWAAEHAVRLHLQYDWMPRAVPTQLIVSLHNDIVLFRQRRTMDLAQRRSFRRTTFGFKRCSSPN